MGLMPQEIGMGCAASDGIDAFGDIESGYVRNEWKLPGVEVELGCAGIVGAGIKRDQEEVNTREEERGRRGKEEVAKEKEEVVKAKKVNWNKPLFNCATGRPRMETVARVAERERERVARERSFTKTSGRGWGYDE